MLREDKKSVFGASRISGNADLKSTQKCGGEEAKLSRSEQIRPTTDVKDLNWSKHVAVFIVKNSTPPHVFSARISSSFLSEQNQAFKVLTRIYKVYLVSGCMTRGRRRCCGCMSHLNTV